MDIVVSSVVGVICGSGLLVFVLRNPGELLDWETMGHLNESFTEDEYELIHEHGFMEYIKLRRSALKLKIEIHSKVKEADTEDTDESSRDNREVVSGSDTKKQREDVTNNDDAKAKALEDKIVAKTAKLAQLTGVPEDRIRESVRESMGKGEKGSLDDSRQGGSSRGDAGNSLGMVIIRVTEWAIFAFVCCLIVILVNIVSRGHLGAIMASLLRVELETLQVKEWVDRMNAETLSYYAQNTLEL
jgi:hypothetical protein